MKKALQGLAAAALAGLALAGPAAAQQTAAQPSNAKPIVIGAPLALTGPYAFVGVGMRRGVELAAEAINAKGGINGAPLTLLVEDSQSDKAQTVNLVSRMVARDDLVAIVGPATTIEVTAVGPLVNEKQVPLLTNSPSAEVRKFGKWSFNVTAAPPDIMVALARYGVETMKVKRVAMVAVRDNETFLTQKNVVRDHWKANGVTVVSEDLIASTDSDFTALATKLADSDIDAISVYMPPEQAANLVRQSRQAGLAETVRILAPPGVVSQPYIKTGGKAVEGTVLVADYFPDGTSELNRAFVDAYRKKHGTAPDNWAAVGYTALQVIETAIRNGGATRAGIQGAMEGIKGMPTLLGDGTFTIGAERAPSYGAAILTVKGDRFVLAQP